jgi:magnesium chelatase family protein
LLDRIDLHVEVTPVSYDELSTMPRSQETSDMVRQRVATAREIQANRYGEKAEIFCNAQMPGQKVREVCALDKACLTLLKTAMERLQLSARAYDRILKVARTIADLSDSEKILVEHLAEAINFRTLDRGNWAGG